MTWIVSRYLVSPMCVFNYSFINLEFKYARSLWKSKALKLDYSLQLRSWGLEPRTSRPTPLLETNNRAQIHTVNKWINTCDYKLLIKREVTKLRNKKLSFYRTAASMHNHNVDLHPLVRAIWSLWGTQLAHCNPIFERNGCVTPHMEEEVKHPGFFRSRGASPCDRHQDSTQICLLSSCINCLKKCRCIGHCHQTLPK